MHTLWRDLRYGIRLLSQRPGYAALAILTLALGIGATTAIFTVADAVIFRPLPFRTPERLVEIWNHIPAKGMSFPRPSFDAIKEWRGQTQLFEQIEAYDTTSFTLVGGDEPERVQGVYVTPGLLPFLGVAPQLGRNFSDEEALPGGGRVTLLSHTLWKQRFGADPSAIGKTITLNQDSYTIVGVMPPSFRFPLEASKLWIPIALTPAATPRSPKVLHALVRLREGVTQAQAQTQVELIGKRLEQEKPLPNNTWDAKLYSLEEMRVQKSHGRALLVLLGAVGFLLLIACVNTANLMLAQSAVRGREIAVRAALGASRLRLIRQLLTESFTLSFCGGAVGVLFSVWGVDLIVKLLPKQITFTNYNTIGVNQRVLLFTLGLSVLTGVLFGLLPAWRGSRTNLIEALKGVSRTATGGAGHSRVRNALVVVELCLSLVLLIGAGLLINSFLRLQNVNPGFDTENLLSVSLQLPSAKYPTGAQEKEFFDQLTAQVAALPGVKGATTAMGVPPQTGVHFGTLWAEGYTQTAADKNTLLQFNRVASDYFNVLGVPLLQGRVFNEQDVEENPRVVIVNQALAKHHWPNGDAVGKRWRLGDDDSPWLTVVGVVGDTKDNGLDDSQAGKYATYYPFPTGKGTFRSRSLLVRTEGDPLSLVPAIKQRLSALDKTQPIGTINTVDQLFYESLAQPRFFLLLMMIFALVALVLAAAGIYGVISYSVAQRTHELGVRVALGAQPRDIIKLVVGQGVVLTLIGVGAGVAAAFGLTRLLVSLLFEVSATDPVTFISVTLLLAGVALVACYLPARRATKVDPLVALRYE